MSDSGVVNGECAYSEERCSSQEILQRDSGFVGMDIPVSVCVRIRGTHRHRTVSIIHVLLEILLLQCAS